jgi:predicted porin
MKKAIISAALMATTALASAQVTVYGRLNATVDSTKTGATTVNSMINDASRIGFRSSEDLGSGLTARAVVETSVASTDPTVGSNTQLGNRTSTVGLSSKLGSVDIGRNLHGLHTTLADADAFAAFYGSVAGDVHNTRGLRLGNAAFVRFTPMQGVGVGIDRTYTATGAEATVYSATATVAGIAVGAARFDQGVEKSTVATAVMGRGNSRLFYSYSDNSGATAKKGHLVGVSHRLGAVTAKASFGRTDQDLQAYAVGAEYAFSKRTDLQVSYRNVDAAGTTADVKQVGVGITHRF